MCGPPHTGQYRDMNETTHKTFNTDSESPTAKGATEAGDRTRRLRRRKDDRMVAGVCSGLADFLGVDANIVRVILAVLTIFGATGFAAYVAGWLLIPEEGRDTSIAQDMISKYTDKPVS